MSLAAPLPVLGTGDAPVRHLDLSAPIDLARTMGAFRVGGADASVRITPGGAWRATRTPDGPATLHVRPERVERDVRVERDLRPGRSHTLVATAWGEGAAWTLAHVHELVGADDDVDSFTPTHPLVHDLHRHHPGLRFGRSRSIVEPMIPTIIEQKVTTIEAHRSWHALVRAHGEPAPGPVPPGDGRPLRLRPDPRRLAELSYADFHRFGIERRRAETILRVCRRAASLERWAHDGSGPAEAAAAMASVVGIGPWTSATVCQQAFGDADAVIVGDYHLPNIVAFNLAGEPRATDDRMLELLAPFAPHRARVVRLLALGGRHAPRRGPGRRLRDIASI